MSGLLYRVGHLCVRRHRIVLAIWAVIVVALFEKGWGAELIGLDHSIPVESFVPLLLVPATMILAGQGNWYFPGWLGRILPHVGLESENALPALAPSREELAPARTK